MTENAVIILRLVDLGYLNLSDHPQDHIDNWPIAGTDPLFNMTLAQLLSFTLGLEVEPFCLNIGVSNFENCVFKISEENTNNGIIPGDAFYYAGTHMQVARMTAYKAFGAADWQAIFSDFKTQTGLFENASFDLPSSSNPRSAGGMHWTSEEYIDPFIA